MEKFLQRTSVADFYEGNLTSFVAANGDVFIIDPVNLRLKRLMDIGISVLGIVLVMVWLFPLIALCVKATSRGPVLFKQKRHGRSNTVFNCYKFRTMHLNAEADLRQATKGDPRVTGLGRFLRKSSLDELPQLFNVLRGEMSLIGPRPHSVPMNEVFEKEVDNYMFRHAVKPGITGLAQTRGYRGEIKSYFDIHGRVRLDHFYIRKWCLWLDVKIIYWTVLTLLFRKGNAY